MPKYHPTAPQTAFIIAITFFFVLLIANWISVTTEIIVTGDRAADILLTQKAAHGWLLTGHYNIYGAHHPGPFFLYMRLLAQGLIGGYTATVFGAHLVGTMACSAAFLGLFTALVHRLATREGACGWTAASAAMVAVLLTLMQLCCPRELAHVDTTTHSGAPANIWMPEVIILPFVTFMVASVLMLRGSVFGLVAATFCAATLVHGYMTMPPIIGPLWLVAFLVGWRTRQAVTGCGFPLKALVWVALICATAALPLVLDALWNHPSNIAEIFETAARARQTHPLLTPLQEAKLLSHPWRAVHPWLWLATVAGLAIVIVTRRYHSLLRDGVVVVVLIVITTALTMSQTPTPAREHTVHFFVGAPLLLIILGSVMVTLELGRRRSAFALAQAPFLLLLFPSVATLYTPYRNFTDVHEAARFLAAENRFSRQVELIDQGKSMYIDGILLDLDRFGIASCYRDPAFAFVLTSERICPQPPRPGINAYWVYRTSPCAIIPDPASLPAFLPASLDGNRITSLRSKDGCVHLVRLPSSP